MNIFDNCVREIKEKYLYKPQTPDTSKLIRVEVEGFVVDLARKGLLDRSLVGPLSDFMLSGLKPQA